MAKVELSNKEAKEFLRKINQQNMVQCKVEQKESKMKNKLSDLNNHLFEQLERLNDEDLKDEADQSGKYYPPVEGYFTTKGKRKPDESLDDYYEKMQKINQYFLQKQHFPSGEGRPDVVARLCMVVDWCIDHPEYTAKIKVIPKKDYPALMPCEF